MLPLGSEERVELDRIPTDLTPNSVIVKFAGTNDGFIVDMPKGTDGIERAIIRLSKGWILFCDENKGETSWIPKDQFEKFLK